MNIKLSFTFSDIVHAFTAKDVVETTIVEGPTERHKSR